ncbi:MAG: CfrBI family restriction endonuclease, partial [Elusimicrobia bacterium CG02_land_8_20_14_3_00_37_13]
TEQVAKNIIKKLLKGEDYRIEVVTLINAGFLQFAIDFFKKVVDAKLKSKNITVDWYKKEFLNPDLPARDIAINSGLNEKTIHNMFNSSTNKKQLNSRKVEWVELRSDGGFKRFETVLYHLKIPHGKLPENIDKKLEVAFREIFK